MGYIEHLATVYPPPYYQFALLGVIGISGLAKVLPVVQRRLHGWFPFLPSWTWTRVAVWELVFVAVYLLLGWKVFAINMSFMLVGGALWVTTFQSKRIPSSTSLLRKTFGLALIPALSVCLLTYCVAFNEHISLQGAPLAIFIGIVFGTVLTGR
eukprot:gene11521-8205_t